MWEDNPHYHIRRYFKMKNRGKKYVAVLDKVEKGKLYTKEEAMNLVKETSVAKFDASVEAVIRLNVDSKKTDQQLRGALVLPNGTGKTKKVLVIAKGENVKIAEQAGADFVGDMDMITKIEKENWFDFDTMIATPDMMPLLGKLGKILGPKGLMPNPKTGTVTTDVKKAIEDVKKGKIEYRTDNGGNVHVIVGKVSFDADKLVENLDAFVSTIIKVKPASVKGNYIKNISVSSTMGPGIKINTNSFDK
jgi:large subunit ribosomal protein L1